MLQKSGGGKRFPSRGEQLKNLDKYVVGAMLYILAWSVVFFVSWIVKGEEPSTLEGCILAPGVVELVCTAIIQHGKNGQLGQNGANDDVEYFDVDNEEAKG